MNLCNKKSSVKVHKTKITEFLEMLPTENSLSKFLILLNPEDFENPCFMIPSLKKRIIYFNDFPGELILYNIQDIEKFNYKIEDTPLPKKLYIMLPKEKIFIDIKNYESRLLASKMDELSNLFMYLGANEVEILEKYKNSKNENLSIGMEVDINQINMDMSNSFGNNSNNFTQNEKIEKFPVNEDIELNIENLTSFYYLPKMSDWQNIVIRRVDGLAEELEYSFINKVNKQLTRKLINKLKKLNISISYEYGSSLLIDKNFKVKFNNLIQENIIYPNMENED